MRNPHKAPLQKLLKTLQTGKEGLSTEEAASRINKFGRNELRVQRDAPEIIKFLLQFKNFFAVLLIFGGMLAMLAEQLAPGEGNLYIATALIAVVLLNASFTYIQQHQSEKIMDSFKKMLPSMVAVIRDGTPDHNNAASLVPGDVILLNEGDRVPADCRLIEASELKVDQSSLTGESEPQTLDPDAHSDALLESRNMVFSGTLVQSGAGVAVVCNTGMSTQIGSVVALTKATDEAETPIHKELKHFIKVISAIAIFLGVAFFLISVAIGNSAIGSLIFAIGIIVANVPEGLLPTVTLSLTMASKRMARKQALIKNLESVETLGSTTVICTDKTGTLTQNRLAVSSFVIDSREITADEAAVIQTATLPLFLETITLCNNAHMTEEGFTGDATDGALLLYAAQHANLKEIRSAEQIDEQPFTSLAKCMITVAQRPGCTPRAYLKGAPEIVLTMSTHLMLPDGPLELSEDMRGAVIDSYRRMAARGERGLAMATRPSPDGTVKQEGYTFLGLVGMIDPPRPEVSDALAKCRSAGIKVAMVTGDYGLTAVTIARQIGLATGEAKIINGDELATMSSQELAAILRDEEELIFARIAPAQKLQVVQGFQSLGEIVTVTGDGVNDAPALKNADMGVAMGLMGTDVAKEASNMVLMDDNFATIVTAIEEGRTIFENIKKFIAYILTSNIPQILPFIAFVPLDIPLPLTVVLILCIDLGTDILPALGLGAEPPETDVMKKKPRNRNERLLSRNLLLVSYGIVGVIQAAAGFFTYFVILYHGGWEWGQSLPSSDPLYRTAITGFFASIIICQIADVIICRTRRQSLLTVGIFSNRLVLIGIGTELILLALISYLPIANAFFGTAPLELWHLALSIPFALIILLGDESRRVLVRRNNPFVLRWLTW